ncbi:MAG TPA: efflux transporter outer membrane subunit [Candidatus Cybelea sp.]|nr:efflux transporter outer membrane subunit [Candidatus Cybelea sp.]
MISSNLTAIAGHLAFRRISRRTHRRNLATPRAFAKAASVAALLSIAGCAVGPDFKHPAAPEAAGYAAEPLPAKTEATAVGGGESQRFLQGSDIPGQWWTLFHSELLNALIEEALKANPDLQAAQAALRVARENVGAQQGAYYPSIGANFSGSRQKVPNDLASPASSGASRVTLYSASVDVSYTVDVFGGTRRQVESLEALAEAQRFQLEAAYLTLTSNVAGAAVQEASLRGQIAATQRIIAIERDSLDLLRREKELGQVADADVAAQEAALAQVEQTLPGLQKQLAQQRDLLAALSGHFPSEEPVGHFELAALQLPQDLPISFPSRLVEQRPDVRAAEANLHAASAQIGVAIANRLPNITLSASDGSVAEKIGQLFTAGTGIWSVAAGVTQPIFQGGTLLHKQRAAEAAYEQAAAQYRSAVLIAFQNVADSLRALQQDANALKAAAVAERAAARSLEIARGQLRLGQITYLALLNAEQAYQQAQVNLIQAQAGRYADTVALFQALGGGWWNRSDVSSTKDTTQRSVEQ